MQQTFYQSRSRIPQPMFLETITQQLKVLRSKEQILEQDLSKLSEHTKMIKKQTKKALESIRDEVKNKIKERTHSIEQVLRTLDEKIQFIIDSCEKYTQKIIKSTERRQDQNNPVLIQRMTIFNDKLRTLQQKIYKFKQQQEQYKKKIEVLKQKNLNLSQQYNVLSIKSKQKIIELETQLRMKIEEIRKRENDKISFNKYVPKQVVNNMQNVSTSKISQIELNQNYTKNKPLQQSVMRESDMNSFSNNSIQLKPDYFSNQLNESNIRQINNPQGKGINLKVLKQDIGGIKVKKLKQSNESIEQKNDETHRVDYLLNNLVATQIQSTQIFEDSILSQESYLYQTP